MTCTRVFSSPLNHSKSKQIYSFPKTLRFTEDPAPMCDKFYDVPSTRSTRSSGFGLGAKSNLVSTQNTPPPGKYEQKGDFQMKKRGYSFTSRPKSGGILDKSLDVTPGPGTYRADYKSLFKNISFSIGKFQEHFHDNVNVGPGKYEIQPSINSAGRYYYSKYRGSRCGKIGQAKRFNESIEDIPGPAKYDIDKVGSNARGQYVQARMKSTHGRSFTKASRDNLRKDPTPGPGTYEPFSEFADKYDSLPMKKNHS